MRFNKNTILPCLVGVVICLVIAGIEGWVTADNLSVWYAGLQKPSFNPPSAVFGPVWTVLYIMIGIAGGLAWCQRKVHPTVFIWFLIQLVFNFLWTFLFFAAESVVWALVDIILLWVSLLVTLACAYRSYRPVFYWLFPYFLWVSFATVLNASIWILN